MGLGVAESAICIRDISDEEHLGRGGEEARTAVGLQFHLSIREGIRIGFGFGEVRAVW